MALLALGLACLELMAYVRLRRRGLLAADRRVTWLAGLTAVQALAWVVMRGEPSWAAVLPALPMLALTALASRPLLPPRLHRRLWAAIAGVTVFALAVAALAK